MHVLDGNCIIFPSHHYKIPLILDRELNVRVGEEDALKIAAKLSQNREVAKLLNKVRDLGPNSEAFDTLKR